MPVRLLILLCSFTFVMGKLEGFIVGGEYVVSMNDFPHVAFLSLRVSNSGDSYSICGSSILNQVILITAAHCLDDVEEITAFVGELIIGGGKLYRVLSFKQHGKWNLPNPRHDIALCRVTSLSLGQAVKRVVLMRRPPSAKTADLAGWGATDETDYSESIQLKYTRQKLWSHKQCNKIVYNAPKGTICGGEVRGKDFASRGDSGSGLLVNNNILIGLVSYKNTNVSRSLVIYTDVAYYYDWIVRTSERLTCY